MFLLQLQASDGESGSGRVPVEPVNLDFGCGSIDSLPGYISIDECSDISGAGNYLFTSNMTCNITVNANDVNIHGNSCTLTGDINGYNPIDEGAGYSFNLINLTANEVSSNGNDTTSDYGVSGHGGDITLTNSSVQSVISNGGVNSAFGYGGNGGRITLNDSNSTIVSSNGGYGYDCGDGGTITLNNVNGLTDVNAIGAGNYNVYYPGNGGNVIFNPAICPLSAEVNVSRGFGLEYYDEGLDGSVTPDCLD